MTLQGQVRIETLDSRALRDNPLGDPHERPLAVYLPPGYDSGSRRYAALIVLAAYTGTGPDLLHGSAWSPGLAERVDLLIACGKMPPVIVAMPHVFTRLGGSQFVNSPALGRYEDYLANDVVGCLDEHFRTLARASSRAVLGRSSGGYGALRLAMHRPGLFAAVACHSGDCYFEYAYKRDFPLAYDTLRRHGGVAAFVEHFESCGEKKSGTDILTLSVLAMAAAYSPDSSRPLGLALPFDEETGALLEDVWRRWEANDPVRLIEEHAGALRGLRTLFIDCGRRDEYALHIGARILSRKLSELGVTHRHEEYDDTHRSTGYRFDVSLPCLAAALAHDR